MVTNGNIGGFVSCVDTFLLPDMTRVIVAYSHEKLCLGHKKTLDTQD